MKNIIVSSFTFACLAFMGIATAATDPDFNRLDTNKDGLISWPEYAAKNPKSGRLDPRRIFDNVDTNRDGYIDPVEFAEMKRRRDNRNS
jgi:Ca2+-binding EF-hand superfamily protein